MIKLITDPNKPLPHFRDVDAFMAHFGVRARGACACAYLQMDQPAAAVSYTHLTLPTKA